jgi:hypothetical protein
MEKGREHCGSLLRNEPTILRKKRAERRIARLGDPLRLQFVGLLKHINSYKILILLQFTETDNI